MLIARWNCFVDRLAEVLSIKPKPVVAKWGVSPDGKRFKVQGPTLLRVDHLATHILVVGCPGSGMGFDTLLPLLRVHALEQREGEKSKDGQQ